MTKRKYHSKKIIHIDMDAFFVAIEIRDNPHLRNRPVAVGGRSSQRGVLSTCNYLAREFGVHSAMPTSVALRKCPDLVVVPGRMDVYKAVSAEIRQIFVRYTDMIEPLSLDEAYLDVSDCDQHSGSATMIAREICQTIARETQLTASAGVAPVKFLAKIASDINKPNGLFVITPDETISFIADMPLNKIPGVGKVTFEKLKEHNLVYGKDVRAYDENTLVENFGKLGRLLWQRCHGIDERDVVSTRVRKSIGVERTFPHDISDINELVDLLTNTLLPELTKRAAAAIAAQTIRTIGVKVKFADFQQTTKDFTYSHIDRDIFVRLLEVALARGGGKKVRLLGAHVGLCHTSESHRQLAFSW